MLSGCASNQQEFYANRDTMWDWSVCKTWRAASTTEDKRFIAETYAEVLKRGMTTDGCNTRNTVADVGAVAVVVLGVVAAVLAAGGSGGGGATTQDYDWAWDQFSSQDGALVWACRGRQSGRFAEEWHCHGKPMADYIWPGPHL